MALDRWQGVAPNKSKQKTQLSFDEPIVITQPDKRKEQENRVSLDEADLEERP
jgi:hypothetical protein